MSSGHLDEQSRALLEEHLELAEIEQLAAHSPLRGPGADMYQYDLTVERGGRRHHLVVSQTALPDNLRPLVRWLEERTEQR